jgi:hypothetical protein
MKAKLVFLIVSTVFFACSTIQKPLTFRAVEREFHFAKPLNEKSQAVILRQFGTVQNYRDSIFARKQRGNNGFVLCAQPKGDGTSQVTVIHVTKEQIQNAIRK